MVDITNFNYITAKIFIKKLYFFGVFKKYAVIVVVPSLKIAKIKTNISKFPFKELTSLNIDDLVKYVNKGKYEIHFTTKNSKLKRILDCYFK
jgi:hypothetical protein